MKRWCIFLYTKQTDSMEQYINYLLEGLGKYTEKLFIICNENVSKDIQKELKKYSDNVITATNIPNGIAGYLDGVKYILTSTSCMECEELLLANDEIYGPIISFDEMLHVMESKNYDYWGIVRHPDYLGENNKLCTSYIGTEFIGISNKLLSSIDFKELLLNISKYIPNQLENNVWNVEEFLEKKNYKVGAYITEEDFIDKNYSSGYDYYQYRSYELLKNMRCPVLFRKCFLQKANMNDNLNKALDYISKSSDYDIEMIWEDALKTMNIVDLKRNLNLNYIISSQESYDIGIAESMYKSTAVIAHIYYSDRVELCIDYLLRIPKEIDIYITTGNEGTYQIIMKKRELFLERNVTISIVPNRGRDISALWVGNRAVLKKYTYVCFVHDKKTSGNIGNAMSGELYQYDVLENCLKNEHYVNNVLSLFESNHKLGFLSPPFPKFFDYINLMGNEWTECFECTQELAHELQLKVEISKDKPPFAFSNTFWCRTEALQPLVNKKFEYEDFPQEPLPRDGSISHAIERIYIYIAQEKGFFSAIMENEEYAEMEINSMQFLLAERVQWNILEERAREKLEDDDKILRGEIARLERDGQILRDYNKDLENIKLSVEKDNLILREQITKLENDGSILRNYIKDLESINTVLKDDDKILRKQIEKLENDGSILRNYIKSLESTLEEKKELERIVHIIKFALSVKKVYIYGAGKIGRKIADELEQFSITYEGFVVSEGQGKTNKINDHSCFYINDIIADNQTGIIVALNTKNTEEVRPNLRSIRNIFYCAEEKR